MDVQQIEFHGRCFSKAIETNSQAHSIGAIKFKLLFRIFSVSISLSLSFSLSLSLSLSLQKGLQLVLQFVAACAMRSQHAG